MPFGDFVNQLPPAVFLIIHLGLFGAGAYMAAKSFPTSQGLGRGFALFAAAEVVYMTYHLDWTVFLFAHTISEVLSLLAFLLIFTSVVRNATTAATGPRR
jgi:hypothetical protein